MHRQKKGVYTKGKSYGRRGGRKGFDQQGGVLCKNCFTLSLEMDRLREENKRLQQTLKHRDRQLSEIKVTHKDVENAHTPSSKRRYKKNSTPENQLKIGGAKMGHPGHGREGITPEQAEEMVRLPLLELCPACQIPLEPRDSRTRSVLEAQPLKAKKVLYRCPRGVCVTSHLTGPGAVPAKWTPGVWVV